MDEAADLLTLATSLLQYIFPIIFILSAIAIADLMFDFIVKIISSVAKRMRFD